MPTDDRAAEDGQAWLEPATTVTAGAIGTWRLTYVSGRRGIAPGGQLGIAWRWPCDWEHPQFEHPAAPAYTSLTTTGPCRLAGSFARDDSLHPWDHLTAITVSDPGLQPGERIGVTFGDTGGGSAGLRAQTFQETACEFRVLVDVDASGRWVHVPRSPALRIVGGAAHRLVLVAPSDVIVGEPFPVTVRVEDRWQNPSPSYRGRVELTLPGDVPGPAHRFGEADESVARITMSLDQPGITRLGARDEDGRWTESNPIICHATPPRYRRYWGDPHSGQSQAGCGAGTVEEHFRYLRDVAAAGFGTHQGNCFMLSAREWAETCRVTRELNQDGEFVAFLGYEWSGDSELGGDHNILFLDDDQPIRRSSHRLVPDRSDEATDLPHITDVYTHYAGGRVVLVPHVGGRTSNLAFHDPELEPVVEIHSGHGTSEWFLAEALARGYQVGVTGGSDDVMGRPGASAPGFAAGRNTRGGLTCVYATGLTREAIFAALRARRTYATTGERIVLWVEADGHPLGSAYATAEPPRIHCVVWGVSSLERLELFRGPELIYAAPVVDNSSIRERTLRVAWSGASARGTGARSKLVWDGNLTIDPGRFVDIRPYGFDSASDALLDVSDRHVRWRSVTALDTDGLVLEYDAPEDALLTFRSPVATFSFHPADVDRQPLVVEAGPVDRRVTVSRLSARTGPRELRFDVVDSQFPAGTSAYYVRVVQDDDEKAWSSPIFVTRTDGAETGRP